MPSLLQRPVSRGKNDSSVGTETEKHCHYRLHSGWQLSWRQARSNPGHGGRGVQGSPPWALQQTVLMSNISDESEATGHRPGDVTVGNDEEWRVRKLIKVGRGVKHLPLGMQSWAAVWINEAVFSSLWPAGQPAAVSSIWKCNEMSIAWFNITPSVSS